MRAISGFPHCHISFFIYNSRREHPHVNNYPNVMALHRNPNLALCLQPCPRTNCCVLAFKLKLELCCAFCMFGMGRRTWQVVEPTDTWLGGVVAKSGEGIDALCDITRSWLLKNYTMAYVSYPLTNRWKHKNADKELMFRPSERGLVWFVLPPPPPPPRCEVLSETFHCRRWLAWLQPLLSPPRSF